VLVKIDEDRMTRGKEVEAGVRGPSKGGIPWIAFLDGEGKVLVTSDATPPAGNGNIGCPVTPQEIDWFMGMLRKVRNRITPEQLSSLEAVLRKWGEANAPPPRQAPATRPRAASRPASRQS
jgi:hypothetical protein